MKWEVGSGKWGVGRWGDGEMGRWGDGEMGRWEIEPKPQNPKTLKP
jgi:hypothetical protein